MKLSKNRVYIIYLISCIGITAGICVGQILGKQLITLFMLLMFLILVVIAAWQKEITPILLFFLPWSTILKLSPESVSFFTIALLLSCGIRTIKFRFSLKFKCLMLAMFILSETLLVKCINNSDITFDYLMFIFMLFFFPIMIGEIDNTVDYKILTFFFSCGIICAALSAKKFANYPNIENYINVYKWNGIIRFSGYYGDSNFYSAQISAALSGTLLLILENEKWKDKIISVLLSLVLLFCGLMSASKTFVFVTIITGAVWAITALSIKNSKNIRVSLLLGIGLSLGYIFSSSVFSNLLKVIVLRFSNISDVSSLTTGRTELWAMYLQSFIDDLRLLLLGNGYTDIKLYGWGSHNTIIQSIYQFGIIGSTLLIFWFKACMEEVTKGKSLKNSTKYIMIIMIGAYFPWMALDMLYFDEFFLIPLYTIAGCSYFFARNNERY